MLKQISNLAIIGDDMGMIFVKSYSWKPWST